MVALPAQDLYGPAMPQVRFEGQLVECPSGTRLRDALRKAGLEPHNGESRWFNCKGFGTCGTCAVAIEGVVPPAGARERARLAFPPHSPQSGLRLACQVRVESDLSVRKMEGFWGQSSTPRRGPQ